MLALLFALSLNVHAEGWDGSDDVPYSPSKPTTRIKHSRIIGEGEEAIIEVAVSSPLHGEFTYRIPVFEAAGNAEPPTDEEERCNFKLTDF